MQGRVRVADMLCNARSRAVLLTKMGVTLGSCGHAQGLGVQAWPRIRLDRAGWEEGKGEGGYKV